MTLDFIWPDNYDINRFVVSAQNVNVFKYLTSPNLMNIGGIFLYGPQYSGKTHIAKAWIHAKNATIVRSDQLTMRQSPYIIDSLDSIQDQTTILNLFWHIESNNLPVLWLSRESPISTKLHFKDLHTRFLSMITLRIDEPDEELFRAIFLKRCEDFGLTLNNDCLDYIIKRVDITYDSLNRLVYALHSESLKSQRSPSVFMLSEVISSLDYITQ